MNSESTRVREGRIIALPKKTILSQQKQGKLYTLITSRWFISVILFVILMYIKGANLNSFEIFKSILIQNYPLHQLAERQLIYLYQNISSHTVGVNFKNPDGITSSVNFDNEWKLDYSIEKKNERQEIEVPNLPEKISNWRYEDQEKNSVKIKFPAEGPISSYFGSRTHPIKRTKEFHKGIDIAANLGSPIRAAHDGKIVEAGFEKTYGKYIKILGLNKTMTLYAHCSELKVHQGQEVKQGQIIALVGDTGSSVGPHLHFEVYIGGDLIDPKTLLDDKM